jgi:CDP-paratose 2-epimerase
MDVAIITGSAGLVGSASVRLFGGKGFTVAGLDNDMRKTFFGPEASVAQNRDRLRAEVPAYVHWDTDIRDLAGLDRVFGAYGTDARVVIHTAAQPSHDWAATDPATDFAINAVGTENLLEMTRKHCPKAVFIFMSTNKIYGDRPNSLPFVETETRWELDSCHPYHPHGVDESMSVDQCMHSLFGASKLAADVLVQEYGRYFGMYTACFRGGCLTGPAHSGAQLHGFLAYLMKCAVAGVPYTVFGYKGKQVRDNLHSADLASMFWHFCQHPRAGEVYNAGGGRAASCSVLEAIALCEKITGKRVEWRYVDANRKGDHLWWISDTRRFRSHFPEWQQRLTLEETLRQIAEQLMRPTPVEPQSPACAVSRQ